MWEFQHKGIINNVCCDGKERFKLYMFYLPLKPARHANASFCVLPLSAHRLPMLVYSLKLYIRWSLHPHCHSHIPLFLHMKIIMFFIEKKLCGA